MQQLHPKAIWLFFWGFILRFLVFFIFCGIWFSFAITPLIIPWLTGRGEMPAQRIFLLLASPFLFFLVILILFIIFFYFWSVWTYQNYKYQFTEDAIKIEKGVIWKKYISIPYERVQNVDIYRGLLARILGLSDLQIQTAGYSAIVSRGMFGGGLGTEGQLPGLDPQTAEQLRDWLIKKVKGTKQGL